MSQLHPARAQRTGGETALRIFFGIFLGLVAIGLAVMPWYTPFVMATVLVMMFAAREWHRMVRSPAQREIADNQPIHVQTAVTVGAIILSVTAVCFEQVVIALGLLVIGAVAAYVLAQRRADNPAWHAVGVLYTGLPALALVTLRVLSPNGILLIVALFMIVWATDTGALVFGKLIGGKKMAPGISPGKTWAGTIGGTVAALAVFAPYAAMLASNLAVALGFALVLSVVAHLGDLLESAIKRRFGFKDSGGLIPGHGGMLDRADSLFAASIVFAMLVFGFGFNPFFGAAI
jgi:phosphatidate cytidylyltransferase